MYKLSGERGILVTEFAIYLVLTLGAGIALGYSGGEKAGRASGPALELPERKDTMSRMIQCRAFCGNKRTGSYDTLTGYCECIGTTGTSR